MNLEIDGLRIASDKDFHTAIAAVLHLSGYYGANLDALNDVLSTDVERPVVLAWLHSENSRAAMGAAFTRIVTVLRHVEAQDVRWGLVDKFELRLA